MGNNTIHLDKAPIASVENILGGMQKKINNINGNLNAEYGSYAELLQAAKAQIASNEKSATDMTMDEYKEYINDKLQTMKRDFTRYQDDETIIISDAGFEVMKNDSEYEAWVLKVVQDNLMTPNYLFGWKNSARISIHQFGATKEEYRGQSYSADHGNNNPVNNEDEDFWLQRHKRMKKILEMEQEMFDNLYELQQLSKHKAEVKSAQMKAEGLVDTSNPMPVITGVPAKYLLGMLTSES